MNAEIECGLCVRASDVGVFAVGDPIAYVNPTCPDHGGDDQRPDLVLPENPWAAIPDDELIAELDRAHARLDAVAHTILSLLRETNRRKATPISAQNQTPEKESN